MSGENLKNTVYIKRLDEYNRDAIRAIAAEGMAELNYRPAGKVFVKPNVVVAHAKGMLGEHGCTPAPFVGACLTALSQQPGVTRIDVGEKSGVGFPTRLCYKNADYYAELPRIKAQARCPVEFFCIEEERRDPVFIGGVVHDVLRVARKMARADTKVYLPKLKVHCVTNVTGAVKLNIGICSEDERAIRHDFLLNDKIVDLLSVGYPDFTIMDAIDVGVGNEGFPIYRKLGLVLMGKSPVAVDMIGTRLLGYGIDDVPYLRKAVQRGYKPAGFEEITIAGDLKSLSDVDEAAKRIMPYDDEFYRWQDVSKELIRLKSPMRFFWGPYRPDGQEKCRTGCVMGLKMFLACFEKYAGEEVFAQAKPVVIVIGNIDEEIDVQGSDAFLFGTCAKARLKNVRNVKKIDKCFCTVSDMTMLTGTRLGMPNPITNKKFVLPIAGAMLKAAFHKAVNLRYAQDIGYFMAKRLDRRI